MRHWVVAFIDSTLVGTLALLGPLAGSVFFIGLAVLLALIISPVGLTLALTLLSHLAEVSGIEFSTMRMAKYAILIVILWITLLRYLSEKKALGVGLGEIEKAFALFIGWSLLCSLFAVRPLGSALTLMRLTTFLLVYLVAKETIENSSHVRLFLWALLISVFSSSVFSFASLASGKYARFTGFFANPNAFGIFLNSSIPLLLTALLTCRQKATRFLFGIGTLLGSCALLLTWSRASWIALFGFVLTFILVERRKKAVIALASVAVFAVIAVLTSAVIYSSFYHLTRIGMSSNRRIVLWQHGIDAAVDRPIIGYGFDLRNTDVRGEAAMTGISEIISFRRSDEGYNPHCLYIAVLVGAGVPGLILVLMIYYRLLKSQCVARSGTSYKANRVMHSAMIGMIVGSILNSMFEMGSLLGSGSYVIYFWLSLGVTAAVSEKKLEIWER